MNQNIVYNEQSNQSKYPFSLPELPYSVSSLSPFLSKEMFDYHYLKHHQSYVDNLNKLLSESYYNYTLEEVILQSYKNNDKGIFNNAAQVWNHTFYWNSMNTNCDINDGILLKTINRDFGNIDDFKQKFISSASHFGSAWIWLVLDNNKKLQIRSTSNANTPITDGEIPMLTCDIWEHAYYIDYKNNRPQYVRQFIDNLVNWDFVQSNLMKSL